MLFITLPKCFMDTCECSETRIWMANEIDPRRGGFILRLFKNVPQIFNMDMLSVYEDQSLLIDPDNDLHLPDWLRITDIEYGCLVLLGCQRRIRFLIMDISEPDKAGAHREKE